MKGDTNQGEDVLEKKSILFLGFCIPEDVAKEAFAMDPLPAVQTYKFGWSFARALKNSFEKVFIASACPVQNFPLVERVFFRKKVFEWQGIQGVMLGFVNIVLLKHLTRFISCLALVTPLIKKNRIEWIFVHGVHSPFLFFSLLAQLRGIRFAVVLTDPPGVVLATDSMLAKLMKRLDLNIVRWILQRSDAVVALAPELVQRLAPKTPALVFPGILESVFRNENTGDKNIIAAPDKSAPFVIVYAGGLNKAYGVDRLIDAVLGLPSDVKVLLKFFGRGDQLPRIIETSQKNYRIQYGGFLESKDLIPELYSADLLINPRPTTESFAAMSFPSKLIEYLSTGRPVLTTKIPSIPHSLEKYFFFIEDETAEGIKMAIEKFINIPISTRNIHGRLAKKFVEESFSEIVIGHKIRKFIEKLN